MSNTPNHAGNLQVAPPAILWLDMDETLGSFGPFCIGVKIWKHFSEPQGINPPHAVSVQHHLHKQGQGERSAFRPGVRELIQRAKQMLDSGRLKEIIIFTSASNAGGYIDYVKECICYHAEVPADTINRIISKEHSTEMARDGATVKVNNQRHGWDCRWFAFTFFDYFSSALPPHRCLSAPTPFSSHMHTLRLASIYMQTTCWFHTLLTFDNQDLKQAVCPELYPTACSRTDNCVIVDDKPYNVSQYKTNQKCVIGVRQYKQYVATIDMLRQASWWDRDVEDEIRTAGEPGKGQYEVSDAQLQTATGLALSAITHDCRQYPPVDDNYETDTDLFKVIEELEKRF
jgi:hypothetical protein